MAQHNNLPEKASGQHTSAARPLWRYDGHSLQPELDTVACERPLTIRLDGEEFATLVCTPEDLEDLAYGFLASEGMIRTAGDIRELQLDAERGFVHAERTRPQPAGVRHHREHSKRFIGSCCGKSRQFYLQSDARTARTVRSRLSLQPAECLALLEQLQDASTVFHRTGGVHNAALCSREGLLQVRSDIGRHNALDKLYGHALRHRLPLADRVLAFSGRVSSEVLLKAAKMGIPLLLSRSAPTDLAVELAEELGLTIVGFIRSGTFNVYSHPQRIRV